MIIVRCKIHRDHELRSRKRERGNGTNVSRDAEKRAGVIAVRRTGVIAVRRAGVIAVRRADDCER